MNSIDVLPDVDIQSRGKVSGVFLEKGILSFQTACRVVKAMPYGSNSDSKNSLILFEEGRGTCTTKHGVIALLAQELDLPVYKNLGFYRLNDAVVTGIDSIIRPYGLSFIPQIHCFLEYSSYRVDLTEGNCNGKNQTIEDYDFVVRVDPDPGYDEKRECYLMHLRHYFQSSPALKSVGEEKILDILEECDHRVKYQCSLMLKRL